MQELVALKMDRYIKIYSSTVAHEPWPQTIQEDEAYDYDAFWIEAMAPNTEPLTIQVEDRPVLNRSFGCF